MILAPTLAAQPSRQSALFDCGRLATGIERYMEIRDLGGDLEKVVASIREYRRQTNATQAQSDAVIREVRRGWAENVPPREASFRVFRRCQTQLGDMGVES